MKGSSVVSRPSFLTRNITGDDKQIGMLASVSSFS